MTTFDITLFNPGSQKEADFLAGFIARQNELRFYLAQLRNTQADQAAKHHLIIAPRGYGKTSLLRRIQIALRDDPEFNTRFIPLAFREEQHNVISLDVLWRNCVQSLLEVREDEHATAAEIDSLDQLWQRLAPRGELKRDEQDGAPAWTAFSEHCHGLGRRPVLLIDNLDTLLAGLERHQWGLRSILQLPDGPVMIAAASRYPDSLSDHKAAFFDFFRISNLPALSDHEVMSCLRDFARMRGDRGLPVRKMLESDPGRISALNTMAGGNPRTLGVLYTVLETHMSDDVLAQLSAMLDTFTGWYQARTEELPLQSRAVFDALALNWDPMTAADLGKVTGLDTPSISSHLSRLEKTGYVEAVSLSNIRKTRSGYQMSERFFNIWYLMRNGPRRMRQAIKFLTIFLRSCFNRGELHEIAKDKLAQGYGRVESTLALASCIEDSRLRVRLLDTAESCIPQDARSEELRALVSELREPSLNDKRGKRSDEDPIKLLLAQGRKFVDQKEFDKAEAEFRQAIALNDKDAYAWWWLGHLLHYCLERNEQAEAAYRKSIALDGKQAGPWSALGMLFHYRLQRYEEAEAAYRQAIALDEKQIGPWVALGDLLQDHLSRYEEAEAAYRQAIALDEQDARPWDSLGSLLQDHLKRYEEAEAAYRQAIAHDPKQVVFLISLGNLLQDYLGRYEDAFSIYQQGLAIKPKSTSLLTNSTYLCALHLGHLDQAHEYAEQVEAGLLPAGQYLLKSMLAWSDGGTNSARRGWLELHQALTCDDSVQWTNYLDELQRILAYAASRGDGHAVLDWMAEAEYPLQFSPLYHAFKTAMTDEDHLLSINPEVRGEAEQIYRGLARMLALFKRDQPTPKRKAGPALRSLR